MENQREVHIDLHTKGKLVFAKRINSAIPQEWLILIQSVGIGDRYSINSFKVKSHISYCLSSGAKFVNLGTPGWWGYSDNYIFYEPTEGHKQKILEILKKEKVRFISPLNKLIKIKT